MTLSELLRAALRLSIPFAMGAVLLRMPCATAQTSSVPPAVRRWSFGSAQPLLQKYCVKCHNSEKHEGEFDLSKFSSRSSMLKERRHWLEVLRVVREAEMPPQDPLPSAAEQKQLGDWIDAAINDIDWEKHRHAGHVVIPRLTKMEYEYTLRDIFGVDLRPGRELLEDGQGASGFTNDRGALFVTGSQLEKYLEAAERLVTGVAALQQPPSVQHFESEDMFMTETRETPKQLNDDFLGYVINRGQMTLYENAQFPVDGYYRFTIRARHSGGPSGTRLRLNDQFKADISVLTDVPTEYSVVVFVPAGSQQMTWNIQVPDRIRELLAEQNKNDTKRKKTKKDDATQKYTKLPKSAGMTVNQQSAKNAPKYPEAAEDSPEIRAIIRRINSANVSVQRPYEWLRLHGPDGDPSEHDRFVGYIRDRSATVDQALSELAGGLDVDVTVVQERLRNHQPMQMADRERLLKVSTEVLKTYVKEQKKIASKPGSVAIDWVSVEGPLPGPRADEAALKWCHDTLQLQQPADVISAFARRVFRRPPTSTEVQRHLTLYEAALRRGDAREQALQSVVAALLVSPGFLFRNEFAISDVISQGERRSPEIANPGRGDQPLNGYQLASRLSYFLWLSLPDERLMELAEAGMLTNSDVLSDEVTRMLADPRSRRMSQAFTGEWLEFALLGKSVVPDENLFPVFTSELNQAMQMETVLTFEHLAQTGGSLLQLLDDDETFLNETLARHYGISDVFGETFQRVALTDPVRGGVTGMASVLTATSTPTRTSPVLRGKWILETLLGEAAGDPPADAGALPGDAGTTEGMTLRQELAVHRRNPSCASCHNKIDPLGFGLENFDAVGRYRTTENGTEIDATGTLPDGTTFTGPAALKRYLVEHRKDQFVENVVRRLLSFALGRELQYYDEPAVSEIVLRVQETDLNAAVLFQQVIRSYPFLHQSRLTDDEILVGEPE